MCTDSVAVVFTYLWFIIFGVVLGLTIALLAARIIIDNMDFEAKNLRRLQRAFSLKGRATNETDGGITTRKEAREASGRQEQAPTPLYSEIG